ncbi:MAG TPA: hypothetical protein PLX56_03160 [bacterium]|nr:hypothetical protein [bacterium]
MSVKKKCKKKNWRENAKKYIEKNKNKKDAKWHTVNFLIKNKNYGVEKRTKIKDIIIYLESKGFKLERAVFQNKVLIPLKMAGVLAVLVYPGKSGGVFIPCGEEDIKLVVIQVIGRICSELKNIKSCTENTSLHKSISMLTDVTVFIKEIIK